MTDLAGWKCVSQLCVALVLAFCLVISNSNIKGQLSNDELRRVRHHITYRLSIGPGIIYLLVRMRMWGGSISND